MRVKILISIKMITTEIIWCFRFLSELNLIKIRRNSRHLLTPKFLIRYAPGHMRKGKMVE